MAKGSRWTDSLLQQNSQVRDNRRRGAPLPGCDCVQCFGHCDLNKDAQQRSRLDAAMMAHKEKES